MIDYYKNRIIVMINKIKIEEQQTDSHRDVSKLNLFYIKSKHAFRYFQNHDYFKYSQSQQESSVRGSKQFVKESTSYGVNNAYNHFCHQISVNYKKKHELQNINRKSLNKNQKNDFCRKARAILNKKSHHLTLPDLTSKDNNYAPKQIQHDQNQDQIINNSKSFKSQKNMKKSLSLHSHIQQKVKFLLIDRFQKLQKLGTCQLIIDIIDYFLNTFLRCKINYKNISQKHYQSIKKYVLEVFGSPQQKFQLKDIVNISQINNCLQKIDSYGCGTVGWQETIRYFFVAEAEVYEYQFLKLKDELKALSNIKFDKELSNQNLLIFEKETGKQVTHFLDLLRKPFSTYLYGPTFQTIEAFRQYQKEKIAQQNFAERIRKWKSISPSEKIEKPISQSFRQIIDIKIKRRRLTRERKQAPKPQKFIERSKLFQEQDFFE